MAYGFTYTAPTATEAGFVIVLKTADFPSAALDGTANALTNGGGNLIAYTSDDKLTRLPVDIVSLVSSGSPAAEVHIRYPTEETAATIYIEADAVQTVQPAVTDTYGRDAVWSGFGGKWHLRGDPATGGTDVTGQGRDLASYYTIPTDAGDGWLYSGGVSRTEAVFAEAAPTEYTISTTMTSSYLSNYGPQVALNRIMDGSWSNSGVFHGSSNGTVYAGTTVSGRLVTSAGALNNSKQHVAMVYDNGTVLFYVNGVFNSSKIGIAAPGAVSGFSFSNFNSGATSTTKFHSLAYDHTARSAAYIAAENANQSAVGAWGAVGAWADAGGGTTDSLTGSSLQSASTVSSGTITQEHSLSGSSLQSISTVTTGTISTAGTDALTGASLASSSIVTTGTLTQSHILTGTSLESASTVSTGAITITHNITGNGLQSLSTVSSGVITQIHALTGTSIQSASRVSTGVLGQVHFITGESIYSISTVSSGILDQPLSIVPAIRTRYISAESRIMSISGEDRVRSIGSENRIKAI